MTTIPVNIVWSIPESLLKQIQNKKHYIIESEHFNTPTNPSVEYFFSLVINDLKTGLMVLYFTLKAPDVESEVIPKLWFANARYLLTNQPITITFTKTGQYTRQLYYIRDVFERDLSLLLHQKLTFRCRGSLTFEVDKRASKNVIMNKLWIKANKNFTFVVGEESIQIDKEVLGAHSSVYKAMFESSYTEAIKNKSTITDFNFTVVTAAVHYCYDRDISDLLNYDDAVSLLLFADKYDMQELKDYTELFLFDHINVDTISELAVLLTTISAKALEIQCATFLADCLRKSIPIPNHEDMVETNLAKEVFRHLVIGTHKL